MMNLVHFTSSNIGVLEQLFIVLFFFFFGGGGGGVTVFICLSLLFLCLHCGRYSSRRERERMSDCLLLRVVCCVLSIKTTAHCPQREFQ